MVDRQSTAVLDQPKQVDITFETPKVDDGGDMWKLVKDSGVLDLNSSYKYLMMCKYFKNTCIVAKSGNDLAGFVTAFIPPEKPDTVFVWQIGVSKDYQGQGIATRVLKELLARHEDVNYLEATVTPSNLPSESLFRGMAKKYNTECQVTACFSEDHFPEDGHEPELSFIIGPLKK